MFTLVISENQTTTSIHTLNIYPLSTDLHWKHNLLLTIDGFDAIIKACPAVRTQRKLFATPR